MITTGNWQHARAIAKRAEYLFNPEADHVISRQVDGVLVGGIIFTQYTGRSIGMHMAGFTPRWATRGLIWIAFEYAFNQLRVERVVIQVSSGNTRAIEIDRKLGFKEVARVPNVFTTGDMIIMVMERSDCRWLRRGKRG